MIRSVRPRVREAPGPGRGISYSREPAVFIRTSRPIPRDPAVVGRETIIHLGITEFARVYASFSQIISAEYSPAEERRIYALAELEINGKD